MMMQLAGFRQFVYGALATGVNKRLYKLKLALHSVLELTYTKIIAKSSDKC